VEAFYSTFFFRNLDIYSLKLATLVGFADNTENVADYSFLPINKLEWLAIPFALGMAEIVDKKDRRVREALFVHGAWGLEAGRLVTTEFA
jgi:hypothetical protein